MAVAVGTMLAAHALRWTQLWPAPMVLLALACWLVAAVWVWRYERRGVSPRLGTIAHMVFGMVIIIVAWWAISVLHHHAGGSGVLALFVLIWTADTAAYFAGRRFGRRKLAPRVSAGKTWEGVWGALIAVAAMALVVSAWIPGAGQGRFQYVLLALLTVSISILGDLTESLFKRLSGKKDSGTWLPGHGGVLDRIDSLTAAAPVYVTGLAWLGGMK